MEVLRKELNEREGSDVRLLKEVANDKAKLSVDLPKRPRIIEDNLVQVTFNAWYSLTSSG